MLLKKLIEILKTLDKAEMKRLNRFIRSDFFNTNESISRLFKLIAGFHPAFNDEKKLSSESLFKGIYGARKYDEKTLRYLISSLYGLVEKFLGIITFETSQSELSKYIIDNMIERRLFNLAAKNLANTESLLDKEGLIGGEYIYNKIDYSLLWHHLYFYSNKQEPFIEKRIEQGEFQMFGSVVELTHIYQIIHRIAYSYNLELKDNIVFEYLRNINFKKTLEYIETNEKNDTIEPEKRKIYRALKIYFCYMITILDVSDEEYFNKLRGLVEEHANLFTKPEQQNLYVMLGTACQKKRRAINEEKYLNTFFDVIKNGVERGLYVSYKAQYIDVENFIMIFKTALQLKQSDWAAEFLRHYGEHIAPEFSEDITNYSFAELYFSKGQFERSLGFLSKVKAKLFRLKAPVRVLMLRLYYELNYFEEAFALIDSFTHFLSSNKNIRTDEKNEHLRFLAYYKELLKARTDGVKVSVKEKTREELKTSSLLPYKAWLLEKAGEQFTAG